MMSFLSKKQVQKRVYGNEELYFPCACKKCPGQLYFILLREAESFQSRIPGKMKNVLAKCVKCDSLYWQTLYEYANICYNNI